MNEITTLHSFRCDLNAGPCETTLDKPLMHQDALGDVFRVAVWRGAEPVLLEGVTAMGYLCCIPSRQTIPITGNVSGCSASVALSSACYAVPGPAALVIQLQQGSIRHSVLKVNLSIDRTGTDQILDPDAILPTLPELLAQITVMEHSTIQAQTAAAEALLAAETARAAAQEIRTVSAPAIIPTATGEFVSITDSAERPFAGLRIYGKTTQNGAPTPTAPVPLVNVGAGGSITITIENGGTLTASTPGGLAGIPSAGGLLCDYKDYGSGMYIQHVQRIVLDGDENITFDEDAFNVAGAIQSGGKAYMQGLCNAYPVATNYGEFISGDFAVCNWSNDALRIRHGGSTDVAAFRAWLAANPVTLYFPLPNAASTPIPADEMAAFRAMHSFKPNTTVYNDAGAALHVDYIADTKLYIDKKIAAIAAASLNV